VSTFYWTIEDFVTEELLPFVFADAEDERQQYTMVIHHVVAKLKSDGRPFGDAGAWQLEGETISTYHQLVDFLVRRLTDDDSVAEWAGRAVGMGTINAFVRRLLSSQRALGHLVRADIPIRADRRVRTVDSKQVTVVDIHNLHDRAQRFVVGVTLKRAFEEKEESGARKPLLFLVLDELNKYAPRDGSSPIKEILLDVAERGRSLGIVLIGAQQTASEVERRVIANSAIRVAGRLDAAEAARPEYGFLPPAHRDRARIAKPGTMFVSQPEIPVPLVAEFPFPAWATRPDEVAERAPASGPAESAPDPFAGLPGA
jgi:DNA helicase HerA-like ATPase